MESKKLEALLMAVDLGSFTKAAEVMGYTQSGLTHMMNSLEREVGFTLLERGRGGVRLTKDGERVAPAIREFLQANARLDSTIAQVASSRSEVIRVSAFASMAMHWLPSIIRRFREERPTLMSTSAWRIISAAPMSFWRRERWTSSLSAIRKRRVATSGSICKTTRCMPCCPRTIPSTGARGIR